MDVFIMIHVMGVVLWIGGVGFATIVIFPTLRGIEDSMEKVRFFLGVERRFSKLAKAYVIVVGITGIYLFFQRGGFGGLNTEMAIILAFKVFVWLLFAVLLFGAEKRLMNILISSQTAQEKAFQRLSLFHWVMLILSLLAIAGGIWITLNL